VTLRILRRSPTWSTPPIAAKAAKRDGPARSGWWTVNGRLPRLLRKTSVLRDATDLLACARVERTTGIRGQSICYIGMLAVRPGAQDRGLGRAMLHRAEAEGIGMGAQVARMTVVSVREGLIAWYERHGYRRTGETERFPYEDARFGAPVRSDLEFVVLEKPLGVPPSA
jgi:ribosomal protein S18 acetylase RimI-like enzyme